MSSHSVGPAEHNQGTWRLFMVFQPPEANNIVSSKKIFKLMKAKIMRYQVSLQSLIQYIFIYIKLLSDFF